MQDFICTKVLIFYLRPSSLIPDTSSHPLSHFSLFLFQESRESINISRAFYHPPTHTVQFPISTTFSVWGCKKRRRASKTGIPNSVPVRERGTNRTFIFRLTCAFLYYHHHTSVSSTSTLSHAAYQRWNYPTVRGVAVYKSRRRSEKARDQGRMDLWGVEEARKDLTSFHPCVIPFFDGIRVNIVDGQSV